jgi:hypothetical protein
MTLVLTTEVYELLCRHVEPATAVYAALLTAAKIEGPSCAADQFWVECDDSDALVYWRVAKERFPDHVKAIEIAINSAIR